MRVNRMYPIYVEFIPEQLENGKLYISEKYGTAIHKCCCGCGEEVVTPLTPVDWRVVKGRGGISLFPSVGNWNYQCKSHYIIRDNRIVWANQMTAMQIESVQKRDFQDKQRYISFTNSTKEDKHNKELHVPTIIGLMKKSWRNLKSFFMP